MLTPGKTRGGWGDLDEVRLDVPIEPSKDRCPHQSGLVFRRCTKDEPVSASPAEVRDVVGRKEARQAEIGEILAESVAPEDNVEVYRPEVVHRT
jgi:hypothetical protein